MKKFLLPFSLVAILALLFLTSGCQSTPVLVRPAQTNTVEVVATNVIAIVKTNMVVTAQPSGIVTNTVVVTNSLMGLSTNVLTVISPPVYYTNISLSPVVETVAKVGGDLAPVPWGGAAGGVLVGLAGTVFGFINERRKRKALGEAMSWQGASEVLVKNFEQVRKEALKIPAYTSEIDGKVMKAVQIAQLAAGVKDKITKIVDEQTEWTKLPNDPQ